MCNTGLLVCCWILSGTLSGYSIKSVYFYHLWKKKNPNFLQRCENSATILGDTVLTQRVQGSDILYYSFLKYRLRLWLTQWCFVKSIFICNFLTTKKDCYLKKNKTKQKQSVRQSNFICLLCNLFTNHNLSIWSKNRWCEMKINITG